MTLIQIRISARNLSWLAGWLEGEGSFIVGSTGLICISAGCSDEDVVRRAAKLMGATPFAPYLRAGAKPIFSFRVTGKIAIAWMRRLLPEMGTRRSADIKLLLTSWDAIPDTPKQHYVDSSRFAKQLAHRQQLREAACS